MSRIKRGAFLTMDSLEGFYCSDNLTYAPLAKLGWEIDEVPWQSPAVCWDDFDLVVIRSPWDYSRQPQAFLKVLEQIERSSAPLANPLKVVGWNLDKRYLVDLEAKGIPIVPTKWLSNLSSNDILEAFDDFATHEIVVKPVIGAGAGDTFLLARDSEPDITERALSVFVDRPLMVQPFVKPILELGEYSLFYFDGEYSHCVLKLPKPGDFRVQEEHGGIIRGCPAPPILLEAGQRVIEAIDERLLYARVDFVFLAHDTPVVIEVELIEPSLYFAYDEQSPVRFACALDRMYRAQ